MSTSTRDSRATDVPGRADGRRGEVLRGDRIYAELRERLISLRIAPGAPIDETVTSRELAVSLGSVREAVRRLATERLVVTFPRRGTFAADISITDLSHICEVRTALEGHAAYRAAERFAALEQDTVQALLHDLARCREVGDVEVQVTLYARLHGFVSRSAANPFMEDSLVRYINLSVRVWRYVVQHITDPLVLLAEHDQILTAIADGDPDQAPPGLVRHIGGFESAIREVL